MKHLISKLLTRDISHHQLWKNSSLLQLVYSQQEAMENFVFPDEIKSELIRMIKLVNIFYVP